MVLAWLGVYGLVCSNVCFAVSLDESWSGAERVAAVRIELEAEARGGGVMCARAGAVPRIWICVCALLRGAIFARCLNMVVKEGNVRQEEGV